MKKICYSIILFFLSFVYSQESKAYEFISNGICYNILSNNDKTVSVTCQYWKNNKGGGDVPTGYYSYWYKELIGWDDNDNEIYQSYQYWFTSDYSGDIVIPSSVVYNSQTYQVTEIGANAFNNISVNSLTIPSSITKIDEDVFRNFKGALVINCNTFAFEGYDDGEYTYYPYSGYWGEGSQISSVSFGSSVTSITSYAFSGCTGLKAVTIPSSVTNIGSSAFSGCSALATVTFMGSVSTIGSSAFPTSAIILVPNGKKSEYVAKLGASYKVYEIDEQFDIDGLLYKIDFSTKTASIVGFSDDTSIAIPETITVDGIVYPVTAIDEYGLSKKNGANSANSTTEINIPSSIKSIGAYAFIYCNSLTRVDITDLEAWCDINFDGEDANPLSKAHNLYLNGVKIDDLVIPNSVENLKKDVFAGGHFSSVSIPSTTNLKWYAGNGQFERAVIGSITIVQNISDAAFFYATIDHLVIAPSVTYGGYQSFNGARIGKLEIPYSETALTYSYGTNSYGFVENAQIDVAIIDRNMYSTYVGTTRPPFYLSRIENLHVGSHIATVAFKDCDLTNVYTKETTPVTIYSNTFQKRGFATLYVPAGSKAAYEAADYWQGFKEIIEMKETVTISSAGMGTFCSTHPLDFSGTDDVKAYIVSAFKPSTGEVTLTRITDVPANTGIVVKGDADTYSIPWGAGETVVANMLVGVTENTVLNKVDGDYTNYILAKKNGNLGFYAVSDGSTLSAGKAYLPLPTAQLPSAARPMKLTFDDEESTGIEQTVSNGEQQGAYYDLQGRRVSTPTRGLYIVNGKKVVIK